MVKRRAAELLRRELSRPKYEPQVLGMSGVTDCYQPAERQFRITRSCLEVLAEFRNPVSLITKNFLITRDIDVLKELAAFDAVHVIHFHHDAERGPGREDGTAREPARASVARGGDAGEGGRAGRRQWSRRSFRA